MSDNMATTLIQTVMYMTMFRTVAKSTLQVRENGTLTLVHPPDLATLARSTRIYLGLSSTECENGNQKADRSATGRPP